MDHPRLRSLPLLAGSVAVVVALAGCASATSGSGGPAGAAGGSGGSAQAAARTSPAPTDLAGLATAVGSAITSVTSVHLTLTTSGNADATDAGNGQGDVTLAAGQATALSFDGGSGATTVSLVYTGGVGYVKLPQPTDPAKPWTQVSATSTNPAIAALATSFARLQSQAALTSYTQLLGAASGFSEAGTTAIDGTPATEYDFTVDPSKLPSSAGLSAQLGSTVGAIPTKFWVDDQDRPLKVSESVTVGGTALSLDVGFSKYDQEVTITAPAADQIAPN